MQTALKLFELPIQAGSMGVDKVAVKMPDAFQFETPEAAFSDIMGALLQLTPEQLQQSLAQLNWVAVQDEGQAMLPLLDLSAFKGDGGDVAKMLETLFTSAKAPLSTSANAPLSASANAPLFTSAKAPLHGSPIGLIASEQGLSRDQAAVVENPAATNDIGALARVFQQTGRAVQANQNAVSGGRMEPAPQSPEQQQTVQMERAAGAAVNEALRERPEAALPRFQDSTNPKGAPPQTQMQAGLNDQTGDEQNGSKKPTLPIENVGEKALRPAKATHEQAAPMVADEPQSESGRPGEPQADGSMRMASAKAAAGKSPVHSMAGPTGAEATGMGEDALPTTEKSMQTDVIRQIVQRMSLRTNGLKSSMSIRLKPDFLGQVHMLVTTENQQVTVRMTAESVIVKEMIEQQLQHLRSELQQHGLEIDRFEVFVGNDNENWKSSQENAAFRQALQQRNRGKFQRPDQHPGEEQGAQADHQPSPSHAGTAEIDYFV